MSDIVILVPVLDRPRNVRSLLDSVAAATKTPCRVLFLVSAGDKHEIRELKRQRAEFVVEDFPKRGNFACKINHGISITDEPWVFAGADDLRFHPGWDEVALSTASATGKRFVGTNDLGNVMVIRGIHSTHSFVARSYIEEWGTIDEPGKLYHEGYGHAWCDNEAVETAKARREWVFARRCVVEHLHPNWPDGHGGKKGVWDATYERGMDSFLEDRTLLQHRRVLWSRNRIRQSRRRGIVTPKGGAP